MDSQKQTTFIALLRSLTETRLGEIRWKRIGCPKKSGKQFTQMTQNKWFELHYHLTNWINIVNYCLSIQMICVNVAIRLESYTIGVNSMFCAYQHIFQFIVRFGFICVLHRYFLPFSIRVFTFIHFIWLQSNWFTAIVLRACVIVYHRW